MKQAIFVVEDDRDIAQLVRHHLEGAGFGVRVFPAATGVIAEAEKHPPALFLLDVMVPGGDGFALCTRIRERQSLAGTPVIFLTDAPGKGAYPIASFTWMLIPVQAK